CARERQVLPGPGFVLLVAREALELGGEWPGAAGRAQPHVDLVEQPVIGRRSERADQALRQPREVLSAVKRPRAVRFRPRGIEIVAPEGFGAGAGGLPPPAELSEREDRRLLAGDAAVLARELVLDRAMVGADQHVRQPGKGLARLLGRSGA